MDDTKRYEDRLAKYDESWNGSRLIMLLGVSLVIALAVIYAIASVRSGDFTWDPTANDLGDIAPSGW